MIIIRYQLFYSFIGILLLHTINANGCFPVILFGQVKLCRVGKGLQVKK